MKHFCFAFVLDPNVIFQTFFGGGGNHFGGFSQQGFPGGFTFQFG